MLDDIITQLEMRLASLEKEAKGSKIDIYFGDGYGYNDYESISLKKFLKLAKGGQFEFKDYGEGIIITTKAYINWNYDLDEDSSFEGIRSFHVSLNDVCRALLTSVDSKEEY
mgnify:CR=1 FL=1